MLLVCYLSQRKALNQNISARLGPLICLHHQWEAYKNKIQILWFSWSGTHSLLPSFSLFLCPSSSFAGKENKPHFKNCFRDFVYVSVCSTLSQCLEVWLWLLPSLIEHIPNGKKKYNCFPKPFSVGLCLLSEGAGFSLGKGNPIPICVGNRVQRTLVLLLKSLSLDFQIQFFWLFLLLSTHPLIQK